MTRELTTSACMYCGEHFTEEQVRTETYKLWHGPGRCVDECEYCRKGIPHAPFTCVHGRGIYAEHIVWR